MGIGTPIKNKKVQMVGKGPEEEKRRDSSLGDLPRLICEKAALPEQNPI